MNRLPLADRLPSPGLMLSYAVSQLGVVESGHNVGLQIEAYQRATWLKPGPWPWCAAFVAWCLKQSGAADVWRCKDARAYGWEDWANSRGLMVLDESAPIKPGDILTFDFSHIGIAESDNGKTVTTIEGNTNADGSREGDGVYRKARNRSLIRRVIRLELRNPN